MSGEIIDAAIAHHTDWPVPGTIVQRMSDIDLPRVSSGTEWWYYNFHLSLVDGRKASAFIAFFRSTSYKPTQPPTAAAPGVEVEYKLCHSYLLNFAISILPADSDMGSPESRPERESEGKYYFTSAMDRDNAHFMRSLIEVDGRMDPLIKRSLLELMSQDKLALPDTWIPGDVIVSSTGGLNLQFGSLASVVHQKNGAGDDVYHIVASAQDGSYGFEIDLIPRKPPIHHGANGVVQGDLISPDDGMYYCFVPRCDVSGFVRIDDSTVPVESEYSMGWYDREFVEVGFCAAVEWLGSDGLYPLGCRYL